MTIDPNLWTSLARSYLGGLTLPSPGQEGYLAYVDASGTNLAYAPPVQDLPVIAGGDALKVLQVDAAGTAVEWLDGSTRWLPLAGGTMSGGIVAGGDIAMGSNDVTGLGYISFGVGPATQGDIRSDGTITWYTRTGLINQTVLAYYPDSTGDFAFGPGVDDSSAGTMYLRTYNGSIVLQTQGVNRWRLTNAGVLYPESTYDLGTTGNRIGTVYCQDVNADGNITVTGTVDGVDVAAHATASAPHTGVYALDGSRALTASLNAAGQDIGSSGAPAGAVYLDGGAYIANDSSVMSRDAADSAWIECLRLTSSDRLILGDTGVFDIQAYFSGAVQLIRSGVEEYRFTNTGIEARGTSKTIGKSAYPFSAGYFSGEVEIGTNPANSGAVRVASQAWVSSRNAANSADISLIRADGSNAVVVGSSANNTTAVYGHTDVKFQVGGASRWEVGSTSITPSADNSYAFGTASFRPTELFAVSGTINTSDEREKQDIAEIPDDLLDRWGAVSFVVYRWIASVETKGEAARIHAGVIAQQIRDALGDDALRYGLLCYDEWDGVEAAGNRWGIRADQCLFVEAAYQRREVSRLAARVDRIESDFGISE